MSINDLQLNFISNSGADIKLSNMAAQLAIDKFDYRYTTLLFLNSTVFYSVELFLRVFNYNIIVNRGVFNSKLIKMSHQYVIFGNDVVDLEQLLNTLGEQEMINIGKFIVICQSQELNDCNEKTIMRVFWEFKIVNIVFIRYEEAQALGFTYHPYTNGDCDNITPIKLINCNSSHSKTDYGEILKRKQLKLNFCPLIVSTFIQQPYMNISNGKPVGADGDLLRMIAYGLNTTVEMMTPHRGGGWGFREKNGSWMGSLADIYDDLANISITSAALTLTRFSDFQISHAYRNSYVVWVMHPATLQNEALKLFYPFREDARITLIVSYVLVILCAFVVKSDIWCSICRDTKKNLYSRSIVFYSWMICMGQTLVKLPTKSTFLQMTILWIYYCFIIRTAYQVYLISSLKGKFYEDQLETIEDAIKAGYPFGGGAALQDFYINYPIVYDSWMNIDSDKVVPTALNISKGSRFVLAMNWDTAKIVMKEHKVNLHILPQKIISSPTVIFFKKYSPLADSINVILSRLVASGFPEMLNKKYTTIFRTVHTDDEHKTLKLLHFTASYAVLVTGWILAIIFFVLEIYFGKVYQHTIK